MGRSIVEIPMEELTQNVRTETSGLFAMEEETAQLSLMRMVVIFVILLELDGVHLKS